ncbi:Hypothetical predicted protein [Mytilus galloprovincialis]|uniref:C1q domain-containing protein n=1 Tax=Mytilus galloprovincialis TaxID=29158 RepID=A0A8B6D9L5_MYTGA|nr:Hypothetical predicted protein [Mytilus galloprovincialis]
MEERQSRHMLQQVVSTLQQKVQSLEQKDISKHTKDISVLQLKVNTVNASCSLCQNNLGDEKQIQRFRNELYVVEDENQKLSQDVAILRQTQSIVAFTAWNEGGNVTSDKVIKFNKVKTSTGVSNLAAIHSTGTFTVEVDGLYIIAVTVNSDTNDSAFEIYKNNIPLSQVYIQEKVGKNDQCGVD